MGVEEQWILEEYPSFDLSRIRHPPTEEHNLDRCAWCQLRGRALTEAVGCRA